MGTTAAEEGEGAVDGLDNDTSAVRLPHCEHEEWFHYGCIIRQLRHRYDLQ